MLTIFLHLEGQVIHFSEIAFIHVPVRGREYRFPLEAVRMVPEHPMCRIPVAVCHNPHLVRGLALAPAMIDTGNAYKIALAVVRDFGRRAGYRPGTELFAALVLGVPRIALLVRARLPSRIYPRLGVVEEFLPVDRSVFCHDRIDEYPSLCLLLHGDPERSFVLDMERLSLADVVVGHAVTPYDR